MRPTFFLIAFAALLLVGCDFDPGDSSPMVGTSPDFKVEVLQSSGMEATLKGFKGKPVILDFWATWCGPCRLLAPHVEKIYEKYKDQGLQAMAITNESRKTVLNFEKGHPHKMPVYLDYNNSANDELHIKGLPTVVVIDKLGQVQYMTVGFDPIDVHGTEQSIDNAVEKALHT